MRSSLVSLDHFRAVALRRTRQEQHQYAPTSRAISSIEKNLEIISNFLALAPKDITPPSYQFPPISSQSSLIEIARSVTDTRNFFMGNPWYDLAAPGYAPQVSKALSEVFFRCDCNAALTPSSGADLKESKEKILRFLHPRLSREEKPNFDAFQALYSEKLSSRSAVFWQSFLRIIGRLPTYWSRTPTLPKSPATHQTLLNLIQDITLASDTITSRLSNLPPSLKGKQPVFNSRVWQVLPHLQALNQDMRRAKKLMEGQSLTHTLNGHGVFNVLFPEALKATGRRGQQTALRNFTIRELHILLRRHGIRQTSGAISVITDYLYPGEERVTAAHVAHLVRTLNLAP